MMEFNKTPIDRFMTDLYELINDEDYKVYDGDGKKVVLMNNHKHKWEDALYYNLTSTYNISVSNFYDVYSRWAISNKEKTYTKNYFTKTMKESYNLERKRMRIFKNREYGYTLK